MCLLPDRDKTRAKENGRESFDEFFGRGKRVLRLLRGKTLGKSRLSSSFEGFGKGPPVQRQARRMSVRQGIDRPVLKHGPRSSTCMRV
jgi:hypothetical protein